MEGNQDTDTVSVFTKADGETETETETVLTITTDVKEIPAKGKYLISSTATGCGYEGTAPPPSPTTTSAAILSPAPDVAESKDDAAEGTVGQYALLSSKDSDANGLKSQQGQRGYQWIELGERSKKSFRKVDLSQLRYYDASEKTHKFSVQEFRFVESCAHNSAFDRLRNDGQARVYVPVQNKETQLYVCFFDAKSPHPVCESVAKITAKVLVGGKYVVEDKLTCFGSDLSDSGILWLAIFNLNCVLGYDLVKGYVRYQFNDIPAPNDVTVSDSDDVIYAACGTGVKGKTGFGEPDHLLLVTPTVGAINELRVLPQPNRPELSQNTYVLPTHCNRVIMDHNISALSGLQMMKNGKIYLTELFDMRSFEPPSVQSGVQSNAGGKNKSLKGTNDKVVWDGTCLESGKSCFFIDNLSNWENVNDDTANTQLLVAAIYRQADANTVSIMKSQVVSTVGWSLTKALCCAFACCSSAVEQERTGRVDRGTLADAEMPLWFSKLDSFDDLCFAVFNEEKKTVHHFKVPNISHVVQDSPDHPDAHPFDGHVTDVSVHANTFIFINFTTKHVLLMDAEEVKDYVC
jgi:hypothetical protein